MIYRNIVRVRAIAAAIVFVIKGSIESALTIGSIEFFLKFSIYYYYERLRTKVNVK